MYSSSSNSESQSSPIAYQYDHNNSSIISSNSTANSQTINLKLPIQASNDLLIRQHTNNLKGNSVNTNFITNSDTSNNNTKSFKLANQPSNLDWNNIIEFTTTNLNMAHHNDASKLSNLIQQDLVQEPEINHNYHSTHDLINDQPNNANSYISNCGDNMFGSFNFFNDEIKLEI